MRENLRLLAQRSWRYRNIEDTFSAIADNPRSIDKSALGHTYKYWSSMLDINLGELLLPLQIPILIAMGQNDESVPPEMALRLKKQFEQRGKNNLVVRIFPDADHRLQDQSHSRSYSPDFLHELAALVQADRQPPDALPKAQ